MSAAGQTAAVATRETRRERGRRHGEQQLQRLVNELRVARQSASVSQAALATEAGWSQSELHRLERLAFDTVSVPRLASLACALGYQLSLRLHPIGDGLHDKGQQALLGRLIRQIDPSFRQSREVPFPNVHDLRSWDMVLRLDEFLIGIEAETRVRDIQELVRRIRQRERDGGVDEIVIVLSDSAHNRSILDQLREALGDRYSTPPRTLLRCLRSGERLPGSGVVLM